MKCFWKAYYYDGKTAERHEAEVSLTPEALEIKCGGHTALWRLDEVDQTQGFHEGEPVRLERGDEALIISEADFVDSLYSMAPGLGRRFRRPDKVRKSLYIAPAAAVLTVAIAAAAYFWMIPAAVRFTAERIPPSVEDSIGRSFIEGLTDAVPECSSPELSDSVNRILKRLEDGAPDNPYRFKLYIINDKTVNALAAPGGHIVLFSGLIESTKRPEELAGVMAHEMQHVLKRHSTQSILQDLSTGVLFSLVFGDFQGISGAVRTVEGLRYGRALEEEADKQGLELLKDSGVDPSGMVGFFEHLWECECKKGKEGGSESVLRYLSTHPPTSERIDYLKKNLDGAPGDYKPLLPGVDWEKVKMSCSRP